MKKWILAVGVVAALSTAGCSSGGNGSEASAPASTTTASAEDEALRAKACESYQAIGERQLRVSAAARKAYNPSLAAAERAEAQRYIDEDRADKSVYNLETNPDECTGPTWDTYYADVKQNVTDKAATSAAKASVAETGVTNWKYLQSEHSKFLGMKCDSFTGSDDTICIGLRNAGIESFVRDATELPHSKARTDALAAADSLKADYADYQARRCENQPDGAVCIGKSLEMDLGHSTIVTIVNREAAAQ
ncbi:hypothetical protein [Prescottella agglutinans]|jgi:hypothetical protein|uniref:Lipoprotein n=1 Tax=Prescottella agglutinans TaxID=1644129 RepID=A0ABT6ML70_9NOCA|nr:hypothetical protein [Prescottella agglutinans]MDH6285052.1 hypothetical protein [Prescottella agglutinans]